MLVRWDIPAAARGSRSAGTRPGILTGVLEATMRDLQVQTPAPGFLAGSHPKVVRRHGQPAHTVPPPRRVADGPRVPRHRQRALTSALVRALQERSSLRGVDPEALQHQRQGGALRWRGCADTLASASWQGLNGA